METALEALRIAIAGVANRLFLSLALASETVACFEASESKVDRVSLREEVGVDHGYLLRMTSSDHP